MSYQALYRVWRPQKFDDIVGQHAVVQTLKNAIAKGKTSHAYLFAGPRGTGKTSAAKIFAKAINCPHQQDGEPCNECALCRAITEGSLSDVVEIDAASNNGVEEIRDIRDKARYAPTQATVKVYIIDEVHMLTTGAFNALLKTLEEPPANVVFILATTEPHKIPATIISRTQRFDFRQISDEALVDRLAFILQAEHVAYEEAALVVLARAAQGGMRDALSLLDQALSYGGEQGVRYQDALQISGSVALDQLATLLQATYNQDAAQALACVHALLDAGKEAGRLLEEWVLFARDVLLQASILQQLDDEVRSAMQKIPATYLYWVIDTLNQTQQAMRFSSQPAVYLDVVSIKLAQPPVADDQTSQAVASLQEQVAQLQELVAQLQQREPSEPREVPAPRPVAKASHGEAFTPNISKIFETLAQATAADKARVIDEWSDVCSTLSVTQRAKVNTAEVLAASPQAIVLGFEYDILCAMTEQDRVLQTAFSQATERLLQHPGQLLCITTTQWSNVRQQFVTAKKAGQLHQYISGTAMDQPQLDGAEEDADLVGDSATDEPAVPEVLTAFQEIIEITE